MLILDPFSTYFREIPDFDTQDELIEAQQLIQRQTAIQNCLLGKESPDLVLDLLEFQGLDPVDYVETVQANVEFVIDNGIIFDDLQSLIIF